MDRRDFFRAAFSKVAKTAVTEAERRAQNKAKSFIRPPFAIDELDFLLACTRCHACIEACPHQVIFPLPASLGIQEVATPALDLLNKGCQLCEDWPCVNACQPAALLRPLIQGGEGEARKEGDEPLLATLPEPLAKVYVDTERCLPYAGPECGACKGSCPVPGALWWDREKPQIEASVCLGCGLCRAACIVEPNAIKIQSIYKDNAVEKGTHSAMKNTSLDP